RLAPLDVRALGGRPGAPLVERNTLPVVRRPRLLQPIRSQGEAMAVCTRRLLALVVAGLGLQASGCDLGSMMYFLMEDPRAPATMKALASKDEKKVPRVAILTWAGLETRSEFIHADRQLSDLLAAQLRDLAEGNQEKLTIVPPRKIEEYKNLHPNW